MATKTIKGFPKFLASTESAYRYILKNFDYDSKEEAMDRAAEYAHIAWSAFHDGFIRIWRAVEVAVLPSGDLDLQVDCLGKAWAFQPKGAGVYNPLPEKVKRAKKSGQTKTIIVEAIAKPTDVDWEYGFASYNTYGEMQSEISMNANAPVEIVAVSEPYRTAYYGESHHSAYARVRRALPEPVLGNTGPDAQEEWRLSTCRNSRVGLKSLGLARGSTGRAKARSSARIVR